MWGGGGRVCVGGGRVCGRVWKCVCEGGGCVGGCVEMRVGGVGGWGWGVGVCVEMHVCVCVWKWKCMCNFIGNIGNIILSLYGIHFI